VYLTWLWIVLSLFLVYAVIPRILTLFFQVGVFKKAHTRREIALTFDDGPDPRFTPMLLDLLRKFNVKATFFIIGEKAEKHPELVLRMYQEGHLIGIHHYVHKSNWFMTPKRSLQYLHRTANIIEKIIGIRPIYYRPPWGLNTLFDFTQKEFKMVLWSLMVGDWWSFIGKKGIEWQIRKRVKGGSVIILHDSGETVGANVTAPNQMLEALKELLPELKENYSLVRIDDLIHLEHQRKKNMSVGKRIVASIWLKWERLFKKIDQLETIDEENQFLYIKKRKYYGQTIQLNDHEQLHRGDQIIEIHLNNEILFDMTSRSKSEVQLAIQLIRSMNQLLPKLAHKIIPQLKEVKALYGITMIYRGTKQFGFTVLELPKGVFSFLTRFYLRLLLYVLHPEGRNRLTTKNEKLQPKIIVMSRHDLLKRYSSESVNIGKIKENHI